MTPLRIYAYNILTRRYFRIDKNGVLHNKDVHGLNRIGGSNYKIVLDFDEYTDPDWLKEACKKKAAKFYGN